MHVKNIQKARIIFILTIIVAAVLIAMLLYSIGLNMIAAVLTAIAIMCATIGVISLMGFSAMKNIVKRCNTPVLAKILTTDVNNPILSYKYKNKKYSQPASTIKQPTGAKMDEAVKKGMLIKINPENPNEICSVDTENMNKLKSIGFILIVIGVIIGIIAIGAAYLH